MTLCPWCLKPIVALLRKRRRHPSCRNAINYQRAQARKIARQFEYFDALKARRSA